MVPFYWLRDIIRIVFLAKKPFINSLTKLAMHGTAQSCSFESLQARATARAGAVTTKRWSYPPPCSCFSLLHRISSESSCQLSSTSIGRIPVRIDQSINQSIQSGGMSRNLMRFKWSFSMECMHADQQMHHWIPRLFSSLNSDTQSCNRVIYWITIHHYCSLPLPWQAQKHTACKFEKWPWYWEDLSPMTASWKPKTIAHIWLQKPSRSLGLSCNWFIEIHSDHDLWHEILVNRLVPYKVRFCVKKHVCVWLGSAFFIYRVS